MGRSQRGLSRALQHRVSNQIIDISSHVVQFGLAARPHTELEISEVGAQKSRKSEAEMLSDHLKGVSILVSNQVSAQKSHFLLYFLTSNIWT